MAASGLAATTKLRGSPKGNGSRCLRRQNAKIAEPDLPTPTLSIPPWPPVRSKKSEGELVLPLPKRATLGEDLRPEAFAASAGESDGQTPMLTRSLSSSSYAGRTLQRRISWNVLLSDSQQPSQEDAAMDDSGTAAASAATSSSTTSRALWPPVLPKRTISAETVVTPTNAARAEVTPVRRDRSFSGDVDAFGGAFAAACTPAACTPPPRPHRPSRLLTFLADDKEDTSLPFAMSPPPRPVKGAAPPVGGDIMAALLAESADGTERFARDFDNKTVLGSGSFAVVYRARNLFDMQEYAVKKTKKPLARGDQRRRETLQECVALATVDVCPYIVRYFASWLEDDRLFIQTELCDGSLKEVMLDLTITRPAEPGFKTEELRDVLSDVATGLAALHERDLVHLDVKPENILVKLYAPSPARARETRALRQIHKIADLGLASAAINVGCDEINEGDCRYMAKELLHGDFSDLKKADIFSLGLTCFELASNPKELPCNGEYWHLLRDGGADYATPQQLSAPMLNLVRWMTQPLPADRPQCSDVLEDTALALPSTASADKNGSEVEQLKEKLKKLEQHLEAQKEQHLKALEKSEELAQKSEEQRQDAERQLLEMRQSAEEMKRTMDRYWSQILQLTRQDMLGDSTKKCKSEKVARERPQSQPPLKRVCRRNTM
eukprot:TRINITY_DN74500_c0_g1_i1.p1 TRINITY_DN74500_c0_g1~~TRINITY_DN74500_c0_g1_i1.p1  ORF type:complete len:667 (+),score=186.02 TRINITY_DN74500_c0_g1_i1:76-2076(+)